LPVGPGGGGGFYQVLIALTELRSTMWFITKILAQRFISAGM